jgi:hypothetical protein
MRARRVGEAARALYSDVDVLNSVRLMVRLWILDKMPKNLFQRHALLGLVLIGACLVIYIVAFFYQQFINSPADLAALVFIVAVYGGAVYNQVKGFDNKQ